MTPSITPTAGDLSAYAGQVAAYAPEPPTSVVPLDQPGAVYEPQTYEQNTYPLVDPSMVQPQPQPQPQPTLPTATIYDIAALGIFSQADLQKIVAAQLTPEEMGAFYLEQLQRIMSQQAQQPNVNEEAAVRAPGWNKTWEQRFERELAKHDLTHTTKLRLMQNFKASEMTKADLSATLKYLATPEGKASLQHANKQVLAEQKQSDAASSQVKSAAKWSAFALGASAIPVSMAMSTANRAQALLHTATTGTAAEQAAARQLLAEIPGKHGEAARAALTKQTGVKFSPGQLSSAASEADRAAAVAALRSRAAATSRLKHPLRKMSLNGAARGLTPATKLSAKDALKYGVGLKYGDVTGGGSKAASAAVTAAKASKGARVLGKLGPIGLVASAVVGAVAIKSTMKAEGGFGHESAKVTGSVGGGLTGAVGGAAAGAAIGTAVFPVVGTGIGGIVGGLIGGFGGSAVGEKLGGKLH